MIGADQRRILRELRTQHGHALVERAPAVLMQIPLVKTDLLHEAIDGRVVAIENGR